MSFPLREYIPSFEEAHHRSSIGNDRLSCDSDDYLEPVLPYRSSTVPQNLSARLKKSGTLPTDGWEPSHWLRRASSRGRLNQQLGKPAPSHSDEFSFRKKSMEHPVESRPVSIAAQPLAMAVEQQIEVKLSNLTAPPPLPPKRTSSSIKHDAQKKVTPKQLIVEHDSDSSADELDVSVALRKISQRLSQLQMEKSPILGHFASLYRLENHSGGHWSSATPKQPSYLPRLHPLIQRPKRCAYTNLVG